MDNLFIYHSLISFSKPNGGLKVVQQLGSSVLVRCVEQLSQFVAHGGHLGLQLSITPIKILDFVS